MNPTQRQWAFFAAGLVLVTLVVAVAWRVVAASSPSVASRTGMATTAAPVLPLPQTNPSQPSTCPVQPAVAAASEKDGQFPMQPDLAGLTLTDMGSFIVIGKESAAAGRLRDAEIAFLMACRLAENLKGPDSIESADARFELGAHYAHLADQDQSEGSANIRTEWLARAQRLYDGSVNTYLTRLGQDHEKSRMAAKELASVRKTLAQAYIPPLPGPASSSASAVAAGSANKPTPVSRMPASVLRDAGLGQPTLADRPARSPASRTGPSFSCSKARSVPEKIICADDELAQLDRDLGRLYARARHAAPNRAAFQREQNEEWRKRESTCRDRECLLRWYAQRRDQLMSIIEGRQPAYTPSAS